MKPTRNAVKAQEANEQKQASPTAHVKLHCEPLLMGVLGVVPSSSDSSVNPLVEACSRPKLLGFSRAGNDLSGNDEPAKDAASTEAKLKGLRPACLCDFMNVPPAINKKI
jgi:hypothetical protein